MTTSTLIDAMAKEISKPQPHEVEILRLKNKIVSAWSKKQMPVAGKILEK